jgi:cytoskeletal protein CcmA (bactofilin family)
MTAEQAGDRGISPIVGVALLVTIVTFLAVTTGYILVGIADETDPQPTVALELEPTESNVTFVLRHRSGEPIDGDKTRLVGVGNEDVLDGERFQVGEKIRIVPVDDEVKLLWFGENTGHIIQTFAVDTSTLSHGIANISSECPWVEQNINANGDLDMNSDKAVCDVTEDTDTGATDIDIDLDSGSVLVGNIDTDGDVDVDSSVVVGDVTTTSSDITVTDNSNIYGDVVASPGTNIDIDGGSSVTGAVVVDGGSVSLDSVDIDGHVYATPGDVSGCSDAELGPDDKSCAAYSFRDPSNYDG